MTIRQISDTNLYVGNSNDSRDIDTMRRLGIKNTVNVAKDLEAPWFHGDFFNYKVSLLDGPGNEIFQYEMAAFVVKTLLDHDKKVLLHCQGGVSRSPSIASLVLVLINKAKTLNEAISIVKLSRPSTNIVPAHIPCLEQVVKKHIP